MGLPILKNGKFKDNFEFKYSIVKSDGNLQYKEITFKFPIDISSDNIAIYADKLHQDFINEFLDKK